MASIWHGAMTQAAMKGCFRSEITRLCRCSRQSIYKTSAAFFRTSNQPPRWIAYSSFETGARQVYVRSFTGVLSGSGGKWQISTGGGSEPTWRRDGSKELFYLNGNKLMAVEVNGDGDSFRAGIPKQLFEMRLTPELRRNRYVVTSDGKRFLMNALVEEQQGTRFRVVLNWPGLLKS
jgi:hypothetical protein